MCTKVKNMASSLKSLSEIKAKLNTKFRVSET